MAGPVTCLSYRKIGRASPRSRDPVPDQALGRTATRFAFAFCVAKTFSLRRTRAPGGRRSPYSR